MKKYQIFVSSTYTDLITERQSAVEAILKAGHIPAGMELFTASNKSQWTIIQKWIDESDIYMLILGGRYGSIEPESGLSYTELEYNYALEKGKPLFAVVMKDHALEEKLKKHGSSVLETDNTQKMKDFKEKVLSNISSFFEDNKDIKLAVHESVRTLEHENKLVGWVRASEMLNPQPYLDQITALQKEKDFLSKENASLKKITKNDQNGEDFMELINILEKEKISLKRIKSVNTDEALEIPDEITLLHAFESTQTRLILGVRNNAGMSEDDKFVFYDVTPRLQIYGLARLEDVSKNSQIRRAIITDKGQNLLQHIARIQHQ